MTARIRPSPSGTSGHGSPLCQDAVGSGVLGSLSGYQRCSERLTLNQVEVGRLPAWIEETTHVLACGIAPELAP